jgi:hypothetical protein
MSALIGSIGQFLEAVRKDVAVWKTEIFPWFRGQPIDKPLLPKVFRRNYPEQDLIDEFRLRAPALANTPAFSDEGEWLFLMQHHGLPTRLLDWTEGALIALYFAIGGATRPRSPVVWMINPVELNSFSIGKRLILLAQRDQGRTYIHRAFAGSEFQYVHPAAIYPNNVHLRMAAQRSRFTIFGASDAPLEDQLADSPVIRAGYLKKYSFDPKEHTNMASELHMYGISKSTVFPDLDGLAEEITKYNSDPSTR